MCSQCKAPWAPVVERGESSWEARKAAGHDPNGYHVDDVTSHIAGNVCTRRMAPDGKGQGGLGWVAPREVLTWRPTCSCSAPGEPATCLDPFSGAGTTVLVADRLGRHGIGIDLNAEYTEMARRRLTEDAGLFLEEHDPGEELEIPTNGFTPQPAFEF